MPWPTMTDYQDALQNPKLSFLDPELRRGVPITDKFGLPKPVTGGFASVYQVDCDGRKWAVRCFLRYHEDTAQRYASIGRYLQQVHLPYMAGFQFLDQGVRVRGQWYPVLKMEWVEGDTLSAYVEKNRRDPQALRRLADQFARMAKDLRQAGIAHGDLQHGNILVVGGNLKLVDYDGMFVPTLSGMPSHEVGHPNYQHPKRDEGDFGPYLDNFSEWVIHLSLLALSARPDLWDLAGAGDEQLLFNQRDFADPGSSKVLRALMETPDDNLQRLTSAFLSLLSCSDISRIPSIDGVRVPADARAVIGAGPLPQARDLAREGSLPDWVYDHIGPAEAEISPPFRAERASVAALLLLVGILARFAALGYFETPVAVWGSLVGIVGVSVSLVLRYRARPEFVRKSLMASQIRGAKREIRRIERSIWEIRRDRDRLLKQEEREAGAIRDRLKDLETREREDLDQVDAWLGRFAVTLGERREALNRAEADELAEAAKSTPVLLLARRASGIVRKYRSKREVLVKQEERARLEAAKRKASIRDKYAKIEAPLRKKLEEAQGSFESRRRSLDSRLDQESQRLNLQKWSLQNLSRELTLYNRVTFPTFIRRVLSLKR